MHKSRMLDLRWFGTGFRTTGLGNWFVIVALLSPIRALVYRKKMSKTSLPAVIPQCNSSRDSPAGGRRIANPRGNLLETMTPFVVIIFQTKKNTHRKRKPDKYGSLSAFPPFGFVVNLENWKTKRRSC